MSPTLRERLVQRAVSGRYDLFLGVGARAHDPRPDPLRPVAAGRRGPAVRAWQLFHVNWLYFTGLAGGSVAFAAVQKVTNAKWSGLIIRFAEAAVAFLPISLIGLVLIFTVGLRLGLWADGAGRARPAALQGGVALARVHVRPAGDRTPGADHRRLEAGTGRSAAGHARGPRQVAGGRRQLYERWASEYERMPRAPSTRPGSAAWRRSTW